MGIRSVSSTGLTVALSLVIVLCVMVVADEQKYDESTPMEELKAAALGDNAEAMAVYGIRLLQGEGNDGEAAEGLDWLNKAVEAGETQALYFLGVIYLNGIGVEFDFDKAIGYMRKGAEAGNDDCQTSMGMIYQAGERIPGGTTADPVEAAKWYRMAAEQDHTEAIQHLAVMYSGRGLERNDEEALQWYRKGADLGNADCIWGLGRCYLKGRGVEIDSVMAYALCFASLDGVENPEQKKAMTARCDELGNALTAEQLDLAKPIIQQWKEKSKQH